MIIIPFIIGVSLRKDDPHFIFGILNENGELGNYPTEESINENITLSILIKNNGYDNLPIKIYHITGNNNTVILNSSGSTGGTNQDEINYNIDDSEEWVSNPINSSFSQKTLNNEHQIIIFELWVNFTGEFEFYSMLYIRLNITN